MLTAAQMGGMDGMGLFYDNCLESLYPPGKQTHVTNTKPQTPNPLDCVLWAHSARLAAAIFLQTRNPKPGKRSMRGILQRAHVRPSACPPRLRVARSACSAVQQV